MKIEAKLVHEMLLPFVLDPEEYIYKFITEKKTKKEKRIQELVKKLREATPSQKVTPSLSNLRSSEANLTTAIKWYIDKFPHTDEQILNEAAKYSSEVVSKGGVYCSPLHYFIMKDRASKMADRIDNPVEQSEVKHETTKSYFI